MISYQPHLNNDLLLEGENVVFEVVKGTVLATTKRSETRIRSSGGGGNTPATVNSTVTVCHEFWVKTEEGREVAVQLRGYDIPLREGQTVTVTQAKKESQDDYVWVSLMNHHSGELHILDTKKLLKNYQPKITTTCFLLSPLVLPIVFPYLKKITKYLSPYNEPNLFLTIYLSLVACLLIFGILMSLSEILKAIFIKPRQEREHQKLIACLQR
jgi:hypothetical protein